MILFSLNALMVTHLLRSTQSLFDFLLLLIFSNWKIFRSILVKRTSQIIILSQKVYFDFMSSNLFLSLDGWERYIFLIYGETCIIASRLLFNNIKKAFPNPYNLIFEEEITLSLYSVTLICCIKLPIRTEQRKLTLKWSPY